jgi:hypothetical protein
LVWRFVPLQVYHLIGSLVSSVCNYCDSTVECQCPHWKAMCNILPAT